MTLLTAIPIRRSVSVRTLELAAPPRPSQCATSADREPLTVIRGGRDGQPACRLPVLLVFGCPRIHVDSVTIGIVGLVDHSHRGDSLGRRGAGIRRRLLLDPARSEEHTSELQSRSDLVCRLLLEKKKKKKKLHIYKKKKKKKKNKHI